KIGVAHTVRAPAALRLGAYASLAFRGAFANPAHMVSASFSHETAWLRDNGRLARVCLRRGLAEVRLA
ncbi:MAG: hypothetical protein CVU79_11775, partial [Elusimicrobia bacterium HGW-Elusimicrobia-3]